MSAHDALRHIINVLGPYPIDFSHNHHHCEGCEWEMSDALLTAINAYTSLPWEPMVSEGQAYWTGIDGVPHASPAPSHTRAERYAWWESHGMEAIEINGTPRWQLKTRKDPD